MGLILESTPEMGEMVVETRRESFYLTGHQMWLYPGDGSTRGVIEIPFTDIPKLRAALDLIEAKIGLIQASSIR